MRQYDETIVEDKQGIFYRYGMFHSIFSIRYPRMEQTEKINFSIPILDSIKNVKIKLVPTQILTLMNVQKREYYVIAIKQKKRKKRGTLCAIVVFS